MFDPEKITFFAKTDARGQQVPFGIKAKDRQRHMYVVGKTGMGKSTLLENMAAQDIANGEGMAFIDPHGSAAQTLLDYVPEHRLNDVIYFAPFDLANPIAFNVMEDVGADKRHLVVSGLMSTFKKIWQDAWSARMEYILTNALLALIEYPDTTLLSVNRMFSDKAFRKQVVDYIKDPAVKAFWVDEFANYTERFAAEALPAIQNKIGQFTGNPLIRNIIGQPKSSFDIRTIMDQKKILIMNLSKGLVGETNANLLGSMLTTRIYLAAMSRADLPVDQMKKMPNFYFYVDEFQSFANATFANILSEARKYHLNLIIAHQYIEQMEEDVRNAVFGNVGTTVAFRVGPFDAEVLETVFSPRFLAPDLVNLGFAQIYLTLMIDGIGSQPFSATTLPPVEKPRVSCKDMVIAASRKNYTATREDVEKIITALHTPPPKEVTPPKDRPKDEVKPASGAKPATVPSPRPSTSDTPRRPDDRKPLVSQASPVSQPTSVRQVPVREDISKVPLPQSVGVPTTAKPASVQTTPARTQSPAPTQPRRPDPSSIKKPLTQHKPEPVTKSADDLRAILAQIAKKESAEQSVGVSTETKPAPVQTAPARTGLSVSGAPKPAAPQGNKKAEPTVLRAALADVLKRVDSTPRASASSTPVAATNPAPTSSTASRPTPIPEVAATPIPPPTSGVAITPDPVHAAVPPTPPTIPVIDFRPQSVAVEERAHMERMAAEAEAMLAQLEAKPTQKPSDDPLSPEKIGRILKQAKDERSPFAS